MAVTKQTSIKLGSGSLATKNGESQVFCEQRVPVNGIPTNTPWSSGSTYALAAPVRYGEFYYNSLQAGNLGQQPDITPLWWIKIDGKDGDMWIQTPVAGYPAGGSDVAFYLKMSDSWVNLAYTPLKVALTDGQLTSASAFEIPAAAFRYMVVDYTVRRGSSHGRKREGQLIILNNGSSTGHTHEFSEIGSDVFVPFTVDLSGSNVRLRYTSALEGVAIELAYLVKGWV